MAMVPTYTNKASVPGSTGMQSVPLSLATSPLSGIGEGMTQVASALDAAATRIQNREDIISSAVANDQFEQATLTDYNAALEAGNILDPAQNTIGNFSAGVEQRIMQTVSNFSGSANARATLEANLRSRAGQYANQMIQYQNTEQRKFITGNAQDEIAPIAAKVAQNPGNLRSSFDQVDAIVNKYAEALDPASERSLRDAGRSAVMEQGVVGLLNRGAWQDARALILDNPVLGKYLDPSKRDQFNKQIATFAQAENKSRVEMAGREATVNRLIASGIKIDPGKTMNFVVGTDLTPDATLGEKIARNAADLDISDEKLSEMPLAQRIALAGDPNIKFEVPVVDYNKDRLPDGKLSVQGANKEAEKWLSPVLDMYKNMAKVQSQYDLWKSGNKSAGLGVLNFYLKMIDDGAVVRDSDIKLAGTTLSASTRFRSYVNSLAVGEAVADSLVEEAFLASQGFKDVGLDLTKGYIDDILEDTGYRPQDIGMRGQTYRVLFEGVKATPRVLTSVDPAAAAAAAAGTPPAAPVEPSVIVIDRDASGQIVVKK